MITDIGYEDMMDFDGSQDGREVTKQCEMCFRYFNKQYKLDAHLNAPHRCTVCCKTFSSHVRLSKFS